MSKVTHTSGPWHRNIPPATKYATVWSGQSTHVAYVTNNHGGLSGEEVEANINLIASSPKLLEALEDALKYAEFERHPHRPWHDKARDAIAQARGEGGKRDVSADKLYGGLEK